MEKYSFEYDVIIYYNTADETAYLVTNDPRTKAFVSRCGAEDVTRDMRTETHTYKLPPDYISFLTDKIKRGR